MNIDSFEIIEPWNNQALESPGPGMIEPWNNQALE
jgi:hypothetical protein